jgi:glycosyltransferase involved in cell wall biosynthesis
MSTAAPIAEPSPLPPERLRVCFVTETFPPEVNGVARTLHRLAAGLGRRGHRIQIVRPQQPRPAPALEAPEVRTVTANSIPLPLYRELRLGLPAGRRIDRLWSEQRPDVVYVATEGLLGWSAVNRARRWHIPVISGFHTNFHAYSGYYRIGLLKPLIYRYLRGLHNRSNCTLVPTAALQGALQANGFCNVEVLGRGVDTELFSPRRRDEVLRQSWVAERDDPVILYVGRIAPEKNLALALRAFEAIRRRTPGARLVLVGDGPQRRALEKTHPDFVFCGTRTGTDLAEHYASGDIFLFPSETETFGNVILEAMASGLAVVAYDYAAAAEVIDPETHGLLAPLGNEAAFVHAAERLAADTVQRNHLRGAARQKALHHNWNAVLERFEALLYTSMGAR